MFLVRCLLHQLSLGALDFENCMVNMLDTFVYEILNELIEVRNLFKF